MSCSSFVASYSSSDCWAASLLKSLSVCPCCFYQVSSTSPAGCCWLGISWSGISWSGMDWCWSSRVSLGTRHLQISHVSFEYHMNWSNKLCAMAGSIQSSLGIGSDLFGQKAMTWPLVLRRCKPILWFQTEGEERSLIVRHSSI